MTSACWIYAKHAAYTNFSFKQISAPHASERYCLDKIIHMAFFHTRPTVVLRKAGKTKGLKFITAILSDIV